MFKRNMLKQTLLLAALGWTLALPAQAVTWQVDIDTATLAGTRGYLDLQLNPGASDAQSVQAHISNFSTDAALGMGKADGAASGSLSGVLILDNRDALNAWLQELVFGSHIAFTLDIDGVLDAGSGSSFASLIWDMDFNSLLGAGAEDAALRINLVPAAAPSWVASSAVQISAVPEPSIAGSLLAGLGLIGFAMRRRSWN